MGLPCTFAVARKPGAKTDNEAVRRLVHDEDAAGAVRQLQRAHVPGRGGGGVDDEGDLHPGVVPAADHPPPHRHAVHGLCRRDLPRPGVLQRAVRRAVPHPAARHRPRPGRGDAGAAGRRAGAAPGTTTRSSCSTSSSRPSRCWCGSRPPSGCATAPSATPRRAGEARVTAARVARSRDACARASRHERRDRSPPRAATPTSAARDVRRGRDAIAGVACCDEGSLSGLTAGSEELPRHLRRVKSPPRGHRARSWPQRPHWLSNGPRRRQTMADMQAGLPVRTHGTGSEGVPRHLHDELHHLRGDRDRRALPGLEVAALAAGRRAAMRPIVDDAKDVVDGLHRRSFTLRRDTTCGESGCCSIRAGR